MSEAMRGVWNHIPDHILKAWGVNRDGSKRTKRGGKAYPSYRIRDIVPPELFHALKHEPLHALESYYLQAANGYWNQNSVERCRRRWNAYDHMPLLRLVYQDAADEPTKGYLIEKAHEALLGHSDNVEIRALANKITKGKPIAPLKTFEGWFNDWSIDQILDLTEEFQDERLLRKRMAALQRDA
tara:strand:- start:2634 stop:3185 length:552 start_codon:yes stop_codon:yes gene_type:complete